MATALAANSTSIKKNITTIDFKPTTKQDLAWRYLQDKATTELYYGGAAGGGKTFLACAWIIISCLQYRGSRWFIGRDSLKSIWQSTFNTLLDIFKNWGLELDRDYSINYKDAIIRFYNESEIYFLDLHHNPTDPEFDRLGSMEFTGGFLEEVAQISKKAKEIIMSRIRYKLDEFGLVPKLLIASNPTKNWVYSEFYLPYKKNQLPEYKKFVQAFVTDNNYISEHYVNNLKKLSGMDRQRLLEGNFDYDSSLAKLFKTENIVNMFTNTYVKSGNKYLSCDVARKGSDKAVIIVWDGFRAEKIVSLDISLTTEIKSLILSLSERYDIPRSNIVIDEDGVGGGLCDILPGVKGFVNNSKALNSENFSNLKAQAYYKLAEMVNNDLIYVNADYDKQEKIIQELEQIEQKDPDKDTKLNIIGKEVIKQNIGRSPDFADALMMRMFFEIKELHSYEVLSLDLF